ncbi:hypothetical protein GGU10DRAFT_377255 [Lentinula aff. detonsa]|uniref:F-box domain-containing protein n=1 Tax=Lentinula aff. detonsa TaxID=2804958 RepID=A0AA38NPA4_9AGAR|nr:hypothetical protein GGU10DRAFT_377255 [Lentinula aff. detonsa]
MKSLPNEVLDLVFQDVCVIDDDEFEFAHRFGSKPAFVTTRDAALLVCRNWNQIACMSFYHTIILSTSEQARCLARTLSSKPHLGVRVRKLLFNGGFGATASKIMKCTSNITHISLPLAVSSWDSTKGLCSSLRSIQPCSLSLNDFNNTYNNIQTRTLVAAICSCVTVHWSRLVKLRFPYETDWEWKEKTENQHLLLRAMYDTPLLKFVRMPAPYNPHLLLPLLSKPTLHAIYSETPFGFMRGHHIKGTCDGLPVLQLPHALCEKIRFPLPGPWVLSGRPYGILQAESNNLNLMFRIEPPHTTWLIG